MEHHADLGQFIQQSEIDFIVPLKQVGLVTRAVLEAVQLFYSPRSIIIITSAAEIEILKRLSPYWNVNPLKYVDEETFFVPNFNLTLEDINAYYGYNRGEQQREPGWWFQQLLKLGAGTQISGISPVYVVWDGDLIPLRRWKICDQDLHGNARHYIAILQQDSRSEFNKTQYADCMKSIAGLTACEPPEGGTFVTHHMVFHTHLVKDLLDTMLATTGSSLPWPLLIMSYSRKFYRFSEYKTYASFLQTKYPSVLQHHRLADFGEGGLRFRDASEVVRQMIKSAASEGISCDIGLSYKLISQYVTQHWQTLSSPVPAHMPAYVQLDHVYGMFDSVVVEDIAAITEAEVAQQQVESVVGEDFIPLSKKARTESDVSLVEEETGDDIPLKSQMVRAR